MINSIDAKERTFDKIQHPVIKIFQQVGYWREIPQLNKDTTSQG